MASCSLRTLHFHRRLFLLLLLLCFFFHFPQLHALQFSCSDFSGEPRLNRSGDALLVDGFLSLTRNRADSNLHDSVGRAVFSDELHLWDSVSGKAADFATHFSFNISMLDPPNGGDGIAFFLAPNGSHIPPNSWGGCLALISNCSNFNTSAQSIVAVEFDTYKNPEWDPSENHFGIDINSIRSVTNLTWGRSMKNGSTAEAWITYDSETTNLSVVLTYPSLNASARLSYGVNLSEVLPEWVSVGFSSATGWNTEIHNILSWEFNSTELTSPPAGKITPESTVGFIVGCVVGSCVVVGMISAFLCFRWRRTATQKEENQESDEDSMDQEFQQGTGPRRFTYNELVQATGNFPEEGKLGEGGFGGVYKGFLPEMNLRIAVKRVSSRSKQGRKEYMAEVKIISRLRHKNLVQLIGWCHEKGEFLLIYEFMPNRSLDAHIFRGERVLSWDLRYKITLGLASALLYLHEEWEQCVVHRDIKSSNVMLDSNFNAKLGDFGLARLMDHERGLRTTGLAGTFGYMAPEYINTGKASEKSDVYSFGVVALEIACGRRSMEARNEEAQVSVVGWVWDSYGKEMLLSVADGKLLTEFDEKEMECLLVVGLWCTHPDYNLRPSIRDALKVLNFEAPLPDLPKTMPVPRYDAHSSSNNSSQPLLSHSSVTLGR